MTDVVQLRISRIATGVFGLLQISIALVSYWQGADQSVVERVLKIAAFTSGPMLGLYLIAVLLPWVKERTALIAFIVGLMALSYVEFSTWEQWPIPALRWPWKPIFWPWYAVIGSLATFGLAALLSQTPLNNSPEESAAA